MDFSNPAVVWGLAGIVLLILEMFTNTFFALFCGIACLITALLTQFFMPENVMYQWISFIAFSIILVLSLMKPLKKKFGNDSVKSTFEDHIGKKVKVIATIPPNSNGKVWYKGAEWNAKSANQNEVASGTEVEIVEMDGINIIVK